MKRFKAVTARLLTCFIAVGAISLAISACSKEKSAKFPEKTPEQVVTRFYDLLSEGGKLTTMEAQSMVSTSYMEYDPDDFRKWTDNFNKETKIKVVNTVMPEGPNARGEWVATVNLEVSTPSSFGDYFTTHSQINCILDKEKNEWKVDFMADTIDEESYRSAPAEARAQ